MLRNLLAHRRNGKKAFTIQEGLEQQGKTAESKDRGGLS